MGEIRYHILRVGDAFYTPELAFRPEATGNPTVTLIQSGGECILVDPGAGPLQNLRQEFQKLCSEIEKIIPIARIDKIFITHPHDDHCNLVSGFWYVPVTHQAGEVAPGITAFPTPGHFPTHKSLEFKVGDKTVVIAGDAIINQDFYLAEDHKRIYRANGYSSADEDETIQTMDEIAKRADLIIPGHGDIFSAKS